MQKIKQLEITILLNMDVLTIKDKNNGEFLDQMPSSIGNRNLGEP